jgi:two-component system OmpR family response regulator
LITPLGSIWRSGSEILLQLITEAISEGIMETKKNILIVDDDQEIREIVCILLGNEGYNLIEAIDSEDALRKVDQNIDLIILDIMMPGNSGFKACRAIRAITSAPILFLSAKTQDSDKSMGFSCGGDDYLSKPFSYTELVSRVKALLRRYYIYKGKQIDCPDLIEIDGLKINTTTKMVFLNEEALLLTEIEYRILLLMAQHRNKIFSTQNLFESIWNEPYFYSCNNTVMVHIRNLRRKIEKNPEEPKYIKTVWGRGYRIE